MENVMILVIGGARSGKSSFAHRLASQTAGRVCFVATARAGDSEMSERICRHRDSRPVDWPTVELVAGSSPMVLPEDADVALLDCFTVFLSELMSSNGLDWCPEDEDEMPEAEVLERMETTGERALAALADVRRQVRLLIVVTNEVGMGVVPPYRLGRVFRDLAGRVNQRLAEEADEVYAVMAGLGVRLKGEDH